MLLWLAVVLAFPSPGTWAALLPYALYLSLALAFGARAARRAGWALWPRITMAFPVLHAGLGLGYLRGVLERIRR